MADDKPACRPKSRGALVAARETPRRDPNQGRADLGVVVAGMHRSGTSAVANALQRGGLYGGRDEDVMAPGAENPDGFGELADVMTFNDRLLDSVGWTWDSPPSAPPIRQPRRQALVGEGRKLVSRLLGSSGPWVVKDPRISVLMPWWRQILFDRFIAVVAVRAPEEVAWSLSVRNGFPRELGLALWAAYYRHLSQGLAGVPTIVVDYASLVASPSDTLVKVRDALLQLGLTPEIDIDQAATSIRPVLRRATHPGPSSPHDDLAGGIQPLVDIWSVGDVVAFNEFRLEAPEPASWESTLLEAHHDLVMAKRALVAQVALAERERKAAADAQARAETIEAALVERERKAAAAAQARAETNEAALAKLSETLATEHAETSKARADSETVRTQLHAAEAKASAMRLERETVFAKLVAAERELATRRAELAAARADAERSRTQLQALNGAVADTRAEAATAQALLESTRVDAERMREQAETARQEAIRAADDAAAARAELTAQLQRRRWLSAQRRPGTDDGRQLRPARRVKRWARTLGNRLLSIPGVLRMWRLLRSNPLFDAKWYADSYPDVAPRRLGAYWHYRRHGIREGRRPNPLFDTQAYLDAYPDVRLNGIDPLDHYLLYGAKEGRRPGPSFDGSWYLDRYPDVALAGWNPLAHYLKYGMAEGRLPAPSALEVSTPAAATNEVEEWQEPTLRADPAPEDDVRAPINWSGLLEGLRGAVPEGGSVAVLTAGEDFSTLSPEYAVTEFPTGSTAQRPTGSVHSATGAIANLEFVRAFRAKYLVTPNTRRDFLETWPAFAAHLARYATCPTSEGTVVRLDQVARAAVAQMARDLQPVLESLSSNSDTRPTLLDLTSTQALTGADVSLQTVRYESPTNGRLSYLDGTIDVVAVDAGDAWQLAEAKRIATHAVLVRDEATQSISLDDSRNDHDLLAQSASIVIPTYRGGRRLAAALDTLAETLAEYGSTQVIVVDDGSEDSAHVEQIVSSHSGITLVRNDANLGFIGSANAGAAKARGDFLIFLNDDVLLLPNWLNPLLGTFRQHADAGIVGGRLVYPDGRLQEAGGMIFADGSAAKFGYGHPDPDHPLFLYVREVDYVSGALLATRRAIFEQLGGFDPAYGFGYYEDVDFAFRVHEAGLKTYYQPESAIVHIEGGTAGTDVTVGPKASQVTNAEIFRTRWAKELAWHPPRPDLVTADSWLALAHDSARRTDLVEA